MQTTDRFTDAWRANRAYLVDLAYRMLSDVGAAEDAVQEAFSRLARADLDAIDDVRGWLTVVTSRLCLDHIRSAWSRRERARDSALLEAVLPHLEAPAPDPADRVTLDDGVRLALLVVLERLSPPERVAFILHDVFLAPFEEVAETLGRPVASCRQLARRARKKVEEGAPARFADVAAAEHRLVTERFITACSNGDVDALLAVLDPDVWGVADLGPGAAISPPPVYGATKVAPNFLRYCGPGTVLVTHPTEDRPDAITLLCFSARQLITVIVLTVEHGVVKKIVATRDPAKLAVLRPPR